MPAPLKQGLDYFPHNTDLSNDDKIEYIEALYGITGYAVYLKLLEKIYHNGYFAMWITRDIAIFSKKIGIEISLCQQIVVSCVNERLFNGDIFEKYNVLTSTGIQKRYLKSCERRKTIILFKEYLCITNQDVNDILGEIRKVNVNIISVNANIYPQSKVKKIESKEKEYTSSYSDDSHTQLTQSHKQGETEPPPQEIQQGEHPAREKKQSKKHSRVKDRSILDLASKLINNHILVEAEDDSINSVYKLLAMKNDKVGAEYRLLKVEERDPENIVKRRFEILWRCEENYKKFVEITEKESPYIIQSNNFFGKRGRWKDFYDISKHQVFKKFRDPCHHDKGRPSVTTPAQQTEDDERRKLWAQYDRFCNSTIENMLLSMTAEEREQRMQALREKRSSEIKHWDKKTISESLMTWLGDEIKATLPDFDAWRKETSPCG